MRKFISNKDWSEVDGKLCKLVSFDTRNTTCVNDKVYTNTAGEYGRVVFHSSCSNEPIEGYIFHKVDFLNLHTIIKNRGVSEEQEVLFFYLNKNYKRIYRIFKIFLPKLYLMVCKKDSFLLIEDKNFKPELKGEARYIASAPIFEIKPEVMK